MPSLFDRLQRRDPGAGMAMPDFSGMTLEELKDYAVSCGVKQEGVGWPTCCPPDGNKDAIIRALKKHHRQLPSRPQDRVDDLAGRLQRICIDNPRHWVGRYAGTHGYTVFPVPKSMFQAMMEVPDPLELGYGRDVPGGDPWSFPRIPGKSLRIAAAWRVENPALWRQYCAARDTVQSELDRLREQRALRPHSLTTELQQRLGDMASYEPINRKINETFLLHGTRPENLEAILANGLSERYSTGIFGQGVYLAENPCKTDQYTRADRRDQRNGGDLMRLHELLYRDTRHPNKPVYYIIVCRIVMGWPVHTHDGETIANRPGESVWSSVERELCAIATGSPTLHHSLVAEAGPQAHYRVHRHREFLQFHSTRIYPAYVLAYHRCLELDGELYFL